MTGASTTWQLPASDDITPDALEYLFSKGQRYATPPWVDIISEPDPASRLSPETVRLQAKVEIMAAEVDLVSNRLQTANCQIGFLLAQLAERDRLLQSLPQYRVSAARASYNYQSERRNNLRMPIDLLIALSMLAFAWMVLVFLLG